MKRMNEDRRAFLKLLASLPVLCVVGCGPEGTVPAGGTADADEAVRRLIRLLGPWKEPGGAEDFIRRFVGSEGSIVPYLADGGESLRRLADRLPDEGRALDAVDLSGMPEEERELLLELTRQLYSFIEVRFHLSAEPEWGMCGGGGRLRYTRAPE